MEYDTIRLLFWDIPKSIDVYKDDGSKVHISLTVLFVTTIFLWWIVYGAIGTWTWGQKTQQVQIRESNQTARTQIIQDNMTERTRVIQDGITNRAISEDIFSTLKPTVRVIKVRTLRKFDFRKAFLTISQSVLNRGLKVLVNRFPLILAIFLLLSFAARVRKKESP